MQHAGQVNPGTMAALVGLEDDAVRDLCRELSDAEGVVVPANYNSPGQLVISGAVSAVKKAVEVAKTRGAKLARELPVSGAFHSPLMKPAAEALSAALAAARLRSSPHSRHFQCYRRGAHRCRVPAPPAGRAVAFARPLDRIAAGFGRWRRRPVAGSRQRLCSGGPAQAHRQGRGCPDGRHGRRSAAAWCGRRRCA